MADISLKIKSDFEQAEKDFRDLKNVSEQTRKDVERFAKSFKTEQIDKFIDRNRRAGIAVGATRGKVQGMTTEYMGLRREIEKLIRKGMSPQDEQLQRLRANYSRLGTELNKLSGQAKKTGLSFMDITKGVLGADLIKRGLSAIAGGIKSVAKEAMKMENVEAAFTPLMGGASRAKDLVKALNIAAAETPFQFEGISDVTKTLLPVMNRDIEKTLDTFKMLGDTAGGNQQKLATITRGYSKAMLKGRVDMESLNMIAEAGVPIFNEMAQSMGYGKNQMTAFFKKISTGTVSTGELTKAFKKMTSEGGIFFKGMEISSKTTSGVMSTLNDNITMMKVEIGKGLLPTLKDLATGFNENREAMINMSRGVGIVTAEIAKRADVLLPLIGLNAAILQQAKRGLEEIGKAAKETEEGQKRMGHVVGGILGDISKGAVRSTIETNTQIKSLHTERVKSFKEMLNIIKMSEQAQYNDSVMQAQDFFVKRAELEAVSHEGRIEFLQNQKDRIATLEQFSASQRLAIEAGLKRAIQKENEKMHEARLQFAVGIIGNAAGLAGSLNQIFKNMGKENLAMAKTFRAISASEALIASYVAFDKTLAATSSLGPVASIAAASFVLAAGLAKAAAIQSTHIETGEHARNVAAYNAAIENKKAMSGQTGLEYTVPDIPAYRHDRAPVMAGGGEHVSITPAGEDVSRDIHVDISVNESKLFSIVQRGISTGKIKVNDRNVGRGVFPS